MLPLSPKNHRAEGCGLWPQGTTGEKRRSAEDYNPGYKCHDRRRRPEEAQRRDARPSQGQAMVRKGLQEEVLSELDPEGHLGISQLKRKGKAEGTAGAKTERHDGVGCV